MEFELEEGDWVWVRRPNEGDFEWWGMDSTKEEEESPSSRPLKVVFAGPAKHWTDAAPVANGRLGAMIWGGVGTEALQLNGSLSFTVSLDSELQHHSSVDAANQFIMEDSCPGKRNPPKDNASEDPKGIQFSAIVDLQIGGNAGMIHIIDDTKLKVESSDWAVLVLAASSSFEGPFTKPSDSKKDPKLTSLNTLNLIRDMSYSKLLAYHLYDYKNILNRVSLQLSKGSNATTEDRRIAVLNQICTQKSLITACRKRLKSSSEPDILTQLANYVMISTAERVRSFNVDEDPTLVELLFHYGQYLLVSCLRPGTQVANLQGI